MLDIRKTEGGLTLSDGTEAVFVQEKSIKSLVNIMKIAPVHIGDNFDLDYLVVGSTYVGVTVADDQEAILVPPNDMYRIFQMYPNEVA